MRLEGLALPFNVWTWHDDYRGYSQFTSDSFSDVIAAGLIRLNVHHRQDRTLASQDDGTLRVWTDADKGVMFEADVEESPLTTFVAHAIEHGFAVNICPCVTSQGMYVPTVSGAPKRIVQQRVLGADFALLLGAKGHYPQTWIRVAQ